MQVELNTDEREELIQLVENYLSDTHVELRRTQTAQFRDRLRSQIELLEGLLDKLRHVADEFV